MTPQARGGRAFHAPGGGRRWDGSRDLEWEWWWPVSGERQFRALQESDLDSLADLLDAVFGVRMSPRELHWKYFSSPPGSSLSSVALRDGDPIGFNGNIPVRFRVAGHDVLGALGVDLAVLESERRLDTFLSLMHATGERLYERQAAFVYGIPNCEASELNKTILGQQSVAPVPLLVKILRIGSQVSDGRMARRGAGLVSAAMRAVRRSAARRRAAVPDGLRLQPVPPADERLDTLWRRMRDDYPVMSVRDTRHLAWRYGASPRAYETIALERVETGALEGYIVLGRLHARGLGRGRIVDLMTPRSAPPAFAAALVRRAVQRFDEAGMDRIDCWMFPHVHLYPALRRQGFIPRDKAKRELHVKPLQPPGHQRLPDALLKPDCWHLCIGDSDVG